MDLAVTYRCNNDCAHCYNSRERNFPELSTEQWFKIIDQLWALGVPHIVFTGGDPLQRATKMGPLVTKEHQQKVLSYIDVGRKEAKLVMGGGQPGGMQGGELAERLTARSPQLKVIYTSGYSPGIAGRDTSLLAGRNFLPKPYSIGKLAQFVRECLDAPAVQRD